MSFEHQNYEPLCTGSHNGLHCNACSVKEEACCLCGQRPAEPGPEGFVRVSPFDSARRRALWMKFDPKGPSLEIRAGREGRDEHIELLPDNDGLDGETIWKLYNALNMARVDCGGNDSELPWVEDLPR